MSRQTDLLAELLSFCPAAVVIELIEAWSLTFAQDVKIQVFFPREGEIELEFTDGERMLLQDAQLADFLLFAAAAMTEAFDA